MVKFGQEWRCKEEKMKKRKCKKDKKMYILRKNDNHELNKNPTVYDRNGIL